MNCLKQITLLVHLPQALSLLYNCIAALRLQITTLLLFMLFVACSLYDPSCILLQQQKINTESSNSPSNCSNRDQSKCGVAQSHQSISACTGHGGLRLGSAEGLQDFPGQSADRSNGGLDQSSCDSGVRTSASSAQEVQPAVHETPTV